MRKEHRLVILKLLKTARTKVQLSEILEKALELLEQVIDRDIDLLLSTVRNSTKLKSDKEDVPDELGAKRDDQNADVHVPLRWSSMAHTDHALRDGRVRRNF